MPSAWGGGGFEVKFMSFIQTYGYFSQNLANARNFGLWGKMGFCLTIFRKRGLWVTSAKSFGESAPNPKCSYLLSTI